MQVPQQNRITSQEKHNQDYIDDISCSCKRHDKDNKKKVNFLKVRFEEYIKTSQHEVTLLNLVGVTLHEGKKVDTSHHEMSSK